MKISKKTIFSLVISFVLMMTVTSVVLAASSDALKKLDEVGGAGTNGSGAGLTKDYAAVTGTMIQGILGVAGLIFLIMIIYAGVQWLIAQGDPTKIDKAKKMIFWCIFGVAIMLMAYAITTYLFTNILGVK